MLRSETDPRWVGVALGDLGRVLVDHAHCEKKAAAQALSLVGAYPQHERLVRRLSALAIEELRHFRKVYAQLCLRGLSLGPDPGDPYARALHGLIRKGGVPKLVDRLLVAGLIESRSCERLGLLATALDEPELSSLYRTLADAESGHARLFEDLARVLAPGEPVDDCLSDLADREADIVRALPLEPRIH